MSWGFERGRVYHRRQDIHARFGGQQQGGIITPAEHSLVIIITAEEGLAHGYADRTRADGVFEYFGEGQIGDMQMLRGNAAIVRHSADGRSLLLFRKIASGLRFEGEMVYENHHIERAPDRTQTMRDAIVFELRPLDNIVEAIEQHPPTSARTLEAMRDLAFAAINIAPQRRLTTTSVIERSQIVRDYVNARARGHCEGCGAEAPFRRSDGRPYLETAPYPAAERWRA